MLTDRRSFIVRALGCASTTAVLASGRVANAGWGLFRRPPACSPTEASRRPPILCSPASDVCPSLPPPQSLPDDDARGFLDVPGRVRRIPRELGVKQIVPIPESTHAKGYALHLGVNWTDPAHYGSTNNLDACVLDAKDLRDITRAHGLAASLLTNEHATTANVLKDIRRAAQTLVAGDLFVLTFSGHGANVDDESGDESENVRKDGGGDPKGEGNFLDETWCLHDRMLIDDELYYEWHRFQQGVRILVILDCCHSGTAIKSVEEAVSRAVEYRSSTRNGEPVALDGAAEEIGAFLLTGDDGATRSLRSRGVRPSGSPTPSRARQKIRTFPRAYNFDLMVRHRDLYAKLQSQRVLDPGRELKATVLLLAACQDYQVAKEEGLNGLFTRSIKKVMKPFVQMNQPFEGNYETFFNRVKSGMGSPAQVPNLYVVGASDPTFLNQGSPFVV